MLTLLKIVFIRCFSVRSIPRKLLAGYREQFDYDFSVVATLLVRSRLLRSSDKNLARRHAFPVKGVIVKQTKLARSRAQHRESRRNVNADDR